MKKYLPAVVILLIAGLACQFNVGTGTSAPVVPTLVVSTQAANTQVVNPQDEPDILIEAEGRSSLDISSELMPYLAKLGWDELGIQESGIVVGAPQGLGLQENGLAYHIIFNTNGARYLALVSVEMYFVPDKVGTPFKEKNMYQIPMVIIGDSISEMPGCAGCEARWNWPIQMWNIDYLFSKGELHNFALGGSLTRRMVQQYASQAHLVKPIDGNEGYLFVFGGTNDIGSQIPVNDIYANLKTLWQNGRNDGYKVMAFTIPPSSSFVGQKETIWQQLNALIIGNATLYDYLVRPDVLLPNPNDPKYYIDGTHPTREGSSVIARTVLNTLNKYKPYSYDEVYLFSGLNRDAPALSVYQDAEGNHRTTFRGAYSFSTRLNVTDFISYLNFYAVSMDNLLAEYPFFSKQ